MEAPRIRLKVYDRNFPGIPVQDLPTNTCFKFSVFYDVEKAIGILDQAKILFIRGKNLLRRIILHLNWIPNSDSGNDRD
jgi:hypothetical protein